MRDKRLLMIALGVIILTLVLLSQMAFVPNALASTQATPVITWSQHPVTTTLAPGGTFSITVSFTSSMRLQNITVLPTPALRGVLTVKPSSFAVVKAGKPYTVELDVAIPPTTTQETFAGSVQIHMGQQVLTRRLHVRLDILQPSDVTIQNFSFTPVTMTVHAGQTVMWKNNGPSTHTTTSNKGVWDSGALTPGKTFSQTFDTIGTFRYHCNIHPFMHGTIVVIQ